MKNHYQTLGLPDLSSLHDIRRAYRKLALQHHPDRGGDTEKMQEINAVYAFLMKNKESYDQQLNGVPVFTIVVNGWSSRQGATAATFHFTF